MQFQKFQAVGNDFLIISENELSSSTLEVSELARRLCDRHRGPGADGLEVLLSMPSGDPAPSADFAIRIYNADGSETPISGNGTRCVGAYLFFNNLWRESVLRIKTGAGIKLLRLIERTSSRFVFETEMGAPRLSSDQVPILIAPAMTTVIDHSVSIGNREVKVTATSMGNPHCTVMVEDVDASDWHAIGAALECHPSFPERTNVEFVRVIDRRNIEVRFWERGVGPTLSSGTGSCAAAIASMLNGKTERKIVVHAEGGELLVEWRKDGTVLQTGEVNAVCRGEAFVD